MRMLLVLCEAGRLTSVETEQGPSRSSGALAHREFCIIMCSCYMRIGSLSQESVLRQSEMITHHHAGGCAGQEALGACCTRKGAPSPTIRRTAQGKPAPQLLEPTARQ